MKIKSSLWCWLGVVLLTMLAGDTFAQIRPANSFRAQATGGVLRDDLDLVYDPIELQFVEGIRLYTNLANLVTTDEEILNELSSNTLLFGISGQTPLLTRMRSSVLVRLRSSSTPNRVTIDSDLNGSPDRFADGDLTDNFLRYFDTNGDGLFDRLTQIDQTVHNNSLNRDYDVVLTGALPFGSSRLGISANFGKGRLEQTTLSAAQLGTGQLPFRPVFRGSPAFSRQLSFEDLNDNFVSQTWSERGDFNSAGRSSFFRLVLSGMKPLALPFGNTETRIDLLFNKFRDESQTADQYSAQQDLFSRTIAGFKNNYNEADEETSDLNIDGTSYGIALDLKRVFQPANERRYDGFWRARAEFERTSGDYANLAEVNFVSARHFFDGKDTLQADQRFDDVARNSVADNGEVSGNRFSLFGVTNIPLGERIHLGLGASWTLLSQTRQTAFTLAASDVERFETLDDRQTAQDVTRRITSSIAADRTFEDRITAVAVPVGLEYAFTDSMRWKLRFGALFIYEKSVNNDASQITESQPQITRNEQGDGTVTITVANNQYSSTGAHAEAIRTNTIFSYGLGYVPTPHLQIDLLGFLGTDDNSIMDANFYRQLRLSFTFRL